MKAKQIIEKLQSLTAPKAWDYFKDLCKDPENVQLGILQLIINANSSCEYGKKYDFSKIKTIDDFRKNIPITAWDDYAEFSTEMQNGKENIIFQGKPKSFIMTSGTSGDKKLIPETANSNEVKIITDKLRRNFTVNSSSTILEGKILPLVNKADLGYTKSGVPFGTASGLTLMHTPPSILKTIAYPLDILKMRDNDTIDYLLMRFSLTQDVRMIVGNNAAKMEKLANFAKDNALSLISEIRTGSLRENIDIDSKSIKNFIAYLQENKKSKSQVNPDVGLTPLVGLNELITPEPERADFLQKILDQKQEFIPKNYWPNLEIMCCWLSGTVGNSVSRIKNIFPEKSRYLDYGYGASEGKFNIPYMPGKSAGTLAIHSAFYEFIPVDDNKNSIILMAHQLKKGEVYRLIVTNFAGLYRYDMKDLVRVDGFTENTPDIVFISKIGDIGNVSGEKLAGSTITQASLACEKRAKIGIKHICAVTVDNPPHYIFCIELQEQSKSSTFLEEFKELLDKELQKDIGYGNKRRDNLLFEPELKIMPKGWLDHLYEENIKTTGNSIAQIKLPVIYDNISRINYGSK